MRWDKEFGLVGTKPRAYVSIHILYVLAGKFSTKEDVAKNHDGRKGVSVADKDWHIIEVLTEIAKELEVKISQVSVPMNNP
jgi:aryl-alcohol dehydrogenase-like predicted oxidoreductase